MYNIYYKLRKYSDLFVVRDIMLYIYDYVDIGGKIYVSWLNKYLPFYKGA